MSLRVLQQRHVRKEGDAVRVEVLEVDRLGRVRLSMRSVDG